jgi:hypothetical protein
VAALVVGGDGNVDVLGRGVAVAKSLGLLVCISICVLESVTYNDGNIDVRSLLDGLGVGARVGDDDQARLLERAGDVIGEVTGSEATGNGHGTGVGGELEDGTLSVGTGRDDANCSPCQPKYSWWHIFATSSA